MKEGSLERKLLLLLLPVLPLGEVSLLPTSVQTDKARELLESYARALSLSLCGNADRRISIRRREEEDEKEKEDKEKILARFNQNTRGGRQISPQTSRAGRQKERKRKKKRKNDHLRKRVSVCVSCFSQPSTPFPLSFALLLSLLFLSVRPSFDFSFSLFLAGHSPGTTVQPSPRGLSALSPSSSPHSLPHILHLRPALLSVFLFRRVYVFSAAHFPLSFFLPFLSLEKEETRLSGPKNLTCRPPCLHSLSLCWVPPTLHFLLLLLLTTFFFFLFSSFPLSCPPSFFPWHALALLSSRGRQIPNYPSLENIASFPSLLLSFSYLQTSNSAATPSFAVLAARYTSTRTPSPLLPSSRLFTAELLGRDCGSRRSPPLDTSG